MTLAQSTAPFPGSFDNNSLVDSNAGKGRGRGRGHGVVPEVADYGVVLMAVCLVALVARRAWRRRL